MAAITPAVIKVSPSLHLPGNLVKYTQVSGYWSALSGNAPQVKLGQQDLMVYAGVVDIRTQSLSAQVSGNQLPSVAINTSLISTPTYEVAVRAEYDMDDETAASSWNLSLSDAMRRGMRQSVFSHLRDSALYGMNPTNGEGILNAAGTTKTNLPPSSYGQTTLLSYDNGELAQFFTAQIGQIMTRIFQLGEAVSINILGPQRVMVELETRIVQLTQYQRTGAGTSAISGVITDVVSGIRATVTWAYDDTLIGKGDGGRDAVIISVPELEMRDTGNSGTNEFFNIAPNISANNIQLTNMAAPMEITTPLPGGAIDVVGKMRFTSGWVLRPEGVTIVSIPYQ